MSALAQKLIAECKRTKAKSLDLGNCGLTKIPDEVFDCVWLKNLSFGTYYSDKSGFLERTKNEGNKNEIISIPAKISQLINLKTLSLDNNQIVDIQTIGNLINLQTLSLQRNQIVDIQSLGNLINLQLLFLDNNQIVDIQSLRNLINLKTLFLENNQIVDIQSLGNLINLQILFLINNPIYNKIPLEIKNNNDAKSILQWAREYYKKDAKPIALNQAKILLLGNTNVGKSFLLHYLETGKLPQNNESTRGLQYKSLEKFGLKINVYDFGGQEFFHGTHQLFFGEDALHLVLWSRDNQLREGQTDRCFELAYWLRCIEQLSKGRQTQKSIETILIENKIDKTDEKGNTIFEPTLLDFTQLESSFAELNLNHTTVSLTHQKRLTGMLELIEERLQTLPATKEQWFQSYQNVIDVINAEKGRGVKVLKADEIEVEGMENKEIQTMIPVFHNLGILLFYPKIESVKDLVFIDPQAFLDVLYKEILNENCQKNNGKLTKKDFDKHNVLNLSSNQILDLLSYFHVIFEVKKGKNEFFAPQYLPDKSHSLLDFFIEYNFHKATLRLESDSYLLNLVMLKIFAVFGSTVKGKESEDYRDYLFWRDGIVIEKDKQLRYIQYHREQQYIDLYADKDFKNFELQKVIVDWILIEILKDHRDNSFKNIERKNLENVLNQLHDKLNRLTWIDNDLLQISASTDGENFAKWKDIQQTKVARFVSNGKEFNLADFKPYLKDKNQMKKIFISYSKQDEKMVNEFIKHLASLTHNKLVETWYCTELKAGEEWDETIKAKLEEADIVCFMISPNFMETPYIHKYEVMNTLKRYDTDKNSVKIVPIILDFCNWSNVYEFDTKDGKKSYKLSDFTGLPFTTKPVRDFQNQNKAWYIIEDALRAIIQENVSSEISSDDLIRKLSPQILKIYNDISIEKI
jgi:internalin A